MNFIDKRILFLLLILCEADVYLQSVRGCNNRLDEANRERNNANRLFDSQNNDRGGYNVGKVNYFEGESVPVSWTNQHGCAGEGTKDCEMNIQIMCDEMMRDGTTTATIPDNPNNCRNQNCELDVKYGMHENYEYYQECKATERNKGLFTANQNLKQDRARYTRQNPGGTRRGYECPEERDYAPYWRPSPWRDLALLTSNTKRCDEYKRESENIKPRWSCKLSNESWRYLGTKTIPLNEKGCIELEKELLKRQTEAVKKGRRGLGGNKNNVYVPNQDPNADTTVSALWTQPPEDKYQFGEPECVQAEATRENHLGLTGKDSQAAYNWKVPYLVPEGKTEVKCVLRMRYNITEDYDGWDGDTLTSKIVYSANSKKKKPNNQNDPAELNVWSKLGFSEKYGGGSGDYEKACTQNGRNSKERKENCREYYFINNPRVDPFGATFKQKNGEVKRLKFQLAMNTAQYSRTFQDRTHTFFIKKRPANIPEDKNIQLVTVAGKRGNIVQTFPGTEYFFFPQIAHVQVGNYLHFEWAGSNTNPNNNDGQGKQGTDRSNVVAMRGANYEISDKVRLDDIAGVQGNSYPAFVQDPKFYSLPKQNVYMSDPNNKYSGSKEAYACRTPDTVAEPLAGLSVEVLAELATGRRVTDRKIDYGNMEELDDAGTSFAIEPQEVKVIGCWGYMSTRNNNFSNRSQKGVICVDEGTFDSKDVGSGQTIFIEKGGQLKFGANTMKGTQQVTFQVIPGIDKGNVSDFYRIITKGELALRENVKAELSMYYEKRALRSPVVYYKAKKGDEWEEFTTEDTEFRVEEPTGKTMATVYVDKQGWYKIDDTIDTASVIGLVIAGTILGGVCLYMLYWKKFKDVHTFSDTKTDLV